MTVLTYRNDEQFEARIHEIIGKYGGSRFQAYKNTDLYAWLISIDFIRENIKLFSTHDWVDIFQALLYQYQKGEYGISKVIHEFRDKFDALEMKYDPYYTGNEQIIDSNNYKQLLR